MFVIVFPLVTENTLFDDRNDAKINSFKIHEIS